MTRLRKLRRAVTSPPRGLLSPVLLLPGRSPQQQLHRELLAHSFANWPRALAMVILPMSWMHWIIVGARRHLRRAVARHGAAVADHHGIDVETQRRRLRRIAYLHCVPPMDAYDLELFLPERTPTMWDHIYTCEIGAFHRWRSLRSGSSPHDLAGQQGLLADKRATCTALHALGIATPGLRAQLSQGSTSKDLQLGDDAAFCRPKVGNAARGAFRAQIIDGLLDVEPVVGGRPPDARAYVDSILALGDLLVEEMIRPHPDFVTLGMPDDLAVVMRIITEDGTAVCAFVELPVRAEAASGSVNAFTAVSVDLATGRIGGRVEPAWQRPADDEVDRGIEIVRENAIGSIVPFAAETRAVVEQACAICPAVHGVAWDVAIGPSGPIILEGNTGWSVRGPQFILGPLAARELHA